MGLGWRLWVPFWLWCCVALGMATALASDGRQTLQQYLKPHFSRTTESPTEGVFSRYAQDKRHFGPGFVQCKEVSWQYNLQPGAAVVDAHLISEAASSPQLSGSHTAPSSHPSPALPSGASFTTLSCAHDQATTVYQNIMDTWPRSLPQHVVIPVRSLSKLVLSTAFSRLVDPTVPSDITPQRFLWWDTPLGSLLPECSQLSHASLGELLSMQALDNRLKEWRLAGSDWPGPTAPPASDHVGMPTLCTYMGWSVLECVYMLVCPAYDHAQPKDVRAIARAYSDEGICVKWVADLGDEETSNNPHPPYTFPTSFTYDNYGYTLVDAAVRLALGDVDMGLLRVADRVLFQPLDMQASRYCMGFSDTKPQVWEGSGVDMCIGAPHLDSLQWTTDAVRQVASEIFVSNALKMSAHDYSKILHVLASGGCFNGRRILTPDMVRQTTKLRNYRQVWGSMGEGFAAGLMIDSRFMKRSYLSWASAFGARAVWLPQRAYCVAWYNIDMNSGGAAGETSVRDRYYKLQSYLGMSLLGSYPPF